MRVKCGADLVSVAEAKEPLTDYPMGETCHIPTPSRLWHCRGLSMLPRLPMPVEIRATTPEDAGTISALNADVQQIHADAHPWRFKQPGPHTFTEKDAKDLLSKPDCFGFLAFDEGAPIGYVVAEVIRLPESPRRFAHELIYIHEISADLANAETASANRFWAQREHTDYPWEYLWSPWTLGRSMKGRSTSSKRMVSCPST
jgi:hypothetical protein